MAQLPQASMAPVSLPTAIAEKQHTLSLQLLQQLPLRNRWDTFFLLNRTFHRSTQDYTRTLTHDLLYRAYREELTGNCEEASRLYRLLLQHNAGSKVTQKARDGLKRIANGTPHTQAALVNHPGKPTESEPLVTQVTQITQATQATQATQVTQSKPVPSPIPPKTEIISTEIISSDDTSILLLMPVLSEQKQPLAQKLAPLLEVDPYTARLTIPSIEFRMLRHGVATDMGPLHQALTAAEIPNYYVSLNAIQSVDVFDILYIESVEGQLVVQVRDPLLPNTSKQMVFSWSDIQQSVEGMLPLFEEVIDRTQKGKIIRKTSTQDHAQIVDLHLSKRQGILRFYDAGYKFQQGIPLVATDNTREILDTKTSWAQWLGLKQLLSTHLPAIPEHHKFNHFATNAVEQIEVLTKIKSHIRLLRRHECYWDQAFQLYSVLHFLQLP